MGEGKVKMDHHEQRHSARHDIRNIIFVLGSAMAFGVVLCLYMIYTYGPSGRYNISNALLDPKVAQQMNYQDGSTRFALSGFQFSHFDIAQKRLIRLPVDFNAYAEFYQFIADKKSLNEVTPAMISLFDQPDMATLVILVHGGNEEKVFQSLQLVPGAGLFRIQLHQQDKAIQWVYFSHPGVYEKAIGLFK
jgi:hypothetical protein